MKVDDIRGQLRRRGVSGISALRKPELVKTLARTLRSEGRGGGAARKATGPAGRAAPTKKAVAKKAPAKKTAAARAKAAPSAKATGARAKKAAPAKKAPAKKAPSARKAAPAKKAPAKKAPSARKAAPARKAPPPRAGVAKATAGGVATVVPSRAGVTATGRATPVRTGRSSSRSVGSSQQITSLGDRPERPGRSLVTANHEVIQRWAQARNAKPATIAGTEREGRPGVLTFNIPGYRESSRIREVSWDDWFRTFDSRGLNLIYQEQMRDGRQSNFFRTENPDREDA
ncbi:MAG: hypothetical protein WA890_29030 [Micromonospora sp.]